MNNEFFYIDDSDPDVVSDFLQTYSEYNYRSLSNDFSIFEPYNARPAINNYTVKDYKDMLEKINNHIQKMSSPLIDSLNLSHVEKTFLKAYYFCPNENNLPKYPMKNNRFYLIHNAPTYLINHFYKYYDYKFHIIEVFISMNDKNWLHNNRFVNKILWLSREREIIPEYTEEWKKDIDDLINLIKAYLLLNLRYYFYKIEGHKKQPNLVKINKINTETFKENKFKIRCDMSKIVFKFVKYKLNIFSNSLLDISEDDKVDINEYNYMLNILDRNITKCKAPLNPNDRLLFSRNFFKNEDGTRIINQDFYYNRLNEFLLRHKDLSNAQKLSDSKWELGPNLLIGQMESQELNERRNAPLVGTNIAEFLGYTGEHKNNFSKKKSKKCRKDQKCRKDRKGRKGKKSRKCRK